MNQIQNQPLQPEASLPVRGPEYERALPEAPELAPDILSEATLPSASRPVLGRETLCRSITLDKRHQALLDLARDIDSHLKVAVRFPRFGVSDFMTGIMAYTIGVSDVELLNFRLLRNPHILPGLIEGLTIGVKAILYDRERIPELPGIQRFDRESLKNCTSDWLAIVSDKLFWEENPGAFSIEIVHIDQLRRMAENSDSPHQHEGYISVWVNRGSRMLDDARRTKMSSAPDISCGCHSIDSESRQSDWLERLTASNLYAIPVDASLVLPVIETFNQSVQKQSALRKSSYSHIPSR